ncbi:MAG: acyltransferase family protein [Burkholderiaceae bacterium]|nr:acyltransferase family protein [Burkholderiaceae bacterium]
MPSSPTHSTYRPDIDGLRAIAVLAVVLFHGFPQTFRGGFIGVDVFFVLSGYLISRIIFEQLNQDTFKFFDFYARRIKRIFPALLIVLVAVYIAGWFTLLADEYGQLGQHIAAGAAFISNFVLWGEAGYFDNSAHTKPLLHLWSLGIEEQFYIVWPLLLWLASKLRFSLFALTLILAALSFYMNVTGIKSDAVATFYSPQTRIWELLIGSGLAWCAVYKKDALADVVISIDKCVWRHKTVADPVRVYTRMANILSCLGFILLIYSLIRFNRDLQFPGKWALIPVLGTAFIVAAGPFTWLNTKILSNKVLVWFGLISYPLYLWHWPLLSFAWIVEASPPSASTRLGLILLSIALAWLTYRLIERPIRFGKHGGLKVCLLVVLMLILGGVGLGTYYERGFPFRKNVQLADALYTTEAHNIEANLVASYRNYAGGEPGHSSKPVVLIIGDSYNPNWSVGLSTVIDTKQYDIVSVSYLGCKVNVTAEKISAIAREQKFERYCQPFERWINDPSVIRRLAVVMLVSYRPFEYEVNKFRFDVLRELKKKNSQFDLFVFGNYFQLDPEQYSSCEKLMYRTGRRADLCLELADYPKKQTNRESLPLYPHDLKFAYVDLIGLTCHQDKTGCPTEAQGVPFISDSHHLNATFIAKLMRDLQATQSAKLEDLGLRKYLVNRSGP